MDLSGRVAVVTGASRGLGFHIAQRLATAGARWTGRVGCRCAASGRQELHAQGAVAAVLLADCSRLDEVERLKHVVTQVLGRPAILVNAAGVFGPLQPIRDSDVDARIQTLLVNTIAPYLTCRALVGGMIDAGWGRIVNVSRARQRNVVRGRRSASCPARQIGRGTAARSIFVRRSSTAKSFANMIWARCQRGGG